MKNIKTTAAVIIFIVCLVLGSAMAKGTFQGYWDQQVTTKSPMQAGNSVANQRVYYKPGMMKTVDDAKGEIMIFRLDKGLMWNINTRKKSYTEMRFEQMEASMNEAKSAMAEQMKNMSPEQRKMMEKMMGGKMGSMMMSEEGPTISFKKTNAAKVVNGHKCKKLLVLMDKTPLMEMWMSDKYDLGTDFIEAYQKMGMFKGNFSNQAAQVKGFPMESSMTMDTGFGTVSSKSIVKKVVAKRIPDSEFALPRGLKKEATPGLKFR